MASELTVREKAEDELSEREAHALRSWRASQQPPLAPSTAAQFMELFLAGKTCEDVRRLNPQFSLGQIVAARISGKWDEHRALYEAELLTGTRRKVVAAQLETIALVSDMMLVASKLHGQKLARFLQTGDEAELQGALKVGSIKDLKELALVLLKATGQDRERGPGDEHPPGPAVVPVAVLLQPAQADEVLKTMIKKKEG